MDRRRAFAAFALGCGTAIALAGAIAAGAGAAVPAAPALPELRWLDPALPRAEIVRLLTTQPRACLKPAADAEAAAQIAIGQAAFRTPLLLGGQAARAGVACASCHRAGRGHPHFAFPGVSGAPGTADVTSAVFSSKRGDGIINPRPIPDLVSAPARIERSAASPVLRSFIRGQVTEEFDGPDPSPAVLDGLAAYVRALGNAACSDALDAPITAQDDADAALAAAAAAARSLGQADTATAHLMIAAARSELGRIDARFAAMADVRRRMGARDADLRQVQALAVTDRAAAAAALARWPARFGRDMAAVRAAQGRSLYAAPVVAAALEQSRRH